MERIKISKFFGYSAWEAELIQVLGHFKRPIYPIHTKNASAFLDRWIKASNAWKQRFSESELNRQLFKIAIENSTMALTTPKEAPQELLKSLWLFNPKKTNNEINFSFEGFAFTIKVNQVSIKVYACGNLQAEYYLQNGFVKMPINYTILILTDFLKNRR